MKAKKVIILIIATMTVMLAVSGCGPSSSFDKSLAGNYEILDVYNTEDFGFITMSEKGLVNADGIDYSGTTADDTLLTLESEIGATESFTYKIDDYKLTLTDSNHENVTYINIDIFSQYKDDNNNLSGSYMDDNGEIYIVFNSDTGGVLPGIGNTTPTPFVYNTHDGIMRLEFQADGETSFEYLFYKKQGNNIAVRWNTNDTWTNLSKTVNDATILGEYSLLYETEDEELSTVFSRLILDDEQYAVLDTTECSYDAFSNNILVLKLPDYNLPLQYRVDGLILELNEIGNSNKIALINEKKLRDQAIDISNITGTYTDGKLSTLVEIKSDSTASLTIGDLTTEYNITASNDYMEMIDRSNGVATYFKYKIEDGVMTLESADGTEMLVVKRIG